MAVVTICSWRSALLPEGFDSLHRHSVGFLFQGADIDLTG